jgi:hypothetical protein
LLSVVPNLLRSFEPPTNARLAAVPKVLCFPNDDGWPVGPSPYRH